MACGLATEVAPTARDLPARRLENRARAVQRAVRHDDRGRAGGARRWQAARARERGAAGARGGVRARPDVPRGGLPRELLRAVAVIQAARGWAASRGPGALHRVDAAADPRPGSDLEPRGARSARRRDRGAKL